MKRNFVQSINPIQKRANSKIVNMNGRYFLIGGLTVSKNTSDIYQFRITNPEEQKYQVEYRYLKFQNNIFTPRNSFAACASNTHLYIWGGLDFDLNTMKQKCLSSLIEVDIQKGKMRQLPLKQNIQVHSSTLFYDKTTNSLIALGGTNEEATLQCYLYNLKLNISEGQKYEWKRKQIKNAAPEGIIWQHSGNLLQKSLLTGIQGQFIVAVGGCKIPQSPYKRIVEIDLQTCEVTKIIDLEEGVVAHESIFDEKKQTLFVIGGANGGGFNRMIYTIKGNKINKFQGHNAVGCTCIQTQYGLIVYGGVFTSEMLNDMILYHD